MMNFGTIEDFHKKNYNLSKLEIGFGIQLICIKRMEGFLLESLEKDILNCTDEIMCNIFFRTLGTYEVMRILKNQIFSNKQLKTDKFSFINWNTEQVNIVFNKEDYDGIIKAYKLLHRLRMPFAKIENEYKKDIFNNDGLFIDDFDPITKDCFFNDNSGKGKISIRETINLFNKALNIFNKYLSSI